MFFWTKHLHAQKTITYAAVSVEHKLYAFGQFFVGDGLRRRRRTDVNVYNTLSLRWLKLVRTGKRFEVDIILTGFTPVLIEHIVYILGRCPDTEPWCNVLYAFDVDTHRWFEPEVSGTVPEMRIHYSACVLGKVIFIHGGCDTNDICKLNTSTMVWSLINTKGTHPHASYNHSANIIGTKMFVFGGGNREGYRKPRVFDTETNCWLTMPSAQPHPEGRRYHSAFVYNGELYIFGGLIMINDLWKLNPETFSWKKVEPNGNVPKMMYHKCCCMVGDRAFLFGGDNSPMANVLCILDLRPSLKTLCKLAVIQYHLQQSELPHNIRWELAAMTR